MNKEMMKRYLYAVGRYLPDKGREDILQELESDLLERMENDLVPSGDAGKNKVKSDLLEHMENDLVPSGDAGADEVKLVNLLKEFGSPDEVGRRYGGRTACLIGADLFPLYNKVLRLVLVLGLSILSFVFLISLVFNPTDLDGTIRLFQDWAVSLAQAALSIFAIVTLSFAVTERVMQRRGESPATVLSAWNPADLPLVPDSPDRIKPAGLIVGVLFNVFFAGILLLRPDDLGIILQFTKGSKPVLIPLLNEGTVSTFLWVLLVLIVLSTCNALWKLAVGHYNAPTRLFSALLSFAGAAVALIVLNQPDLLDPTRGLQNLIPPEQTDNLILALTLSLRITSFAIAIPCVVEGVQHLLHLFGLSLFPKKTKVAAHR